MNGGYITLEQAKAELADKDLHGQIALLYKAIANQCVACDTRKSECDKQYLKRSTLRALLLVCAGFAAGSSGISVFAAFKLIGVF